MELQILLFGEEMKPAKGTEKEWTFGRKCLRAGIGSIEKREMMETFDKNKK